LSPIFDIDVFDSGKVFFVVDDYLAIAITFKTDDFLQPFSLIKMTKLESGSFKSSCSNRLKLVNDNSLVFIYQSYGILRYYDAIYLH